MVPGEDASTYRPLVVINGLVLPSVLPSVGRSELPREMAVREEAVRESPRSACTWKRDTKKCSPSKESGFAEIVVHGNRHAGGGRLEKVNRAESERRAAELENDGGVPLKMAHVTMTC